MKMWTIVAIVDWIPLSSTPRVAAHQTHDEHSHSHVCLKTKHCEVLSSASSRRCFWGETESSEHKEGMIMVLGKSMTRLKRFYAVEFAKLKIASFCDHIWVPTVVKT